MHVVSGPLFLPEAGADGTAPPPAGAAASARAQRLVRYRLVGDRGVAVPTHLYKVGAVAQHRAA